MLNIINKLYRIFIVVWMLLVAFGGVGCDQPLFRNDLEAIQAEGELVVITRNSPECYYQGPFGPSGFEYDLVTTFADHLGVQTRTIIVEDEAEMVETLLEGKAHIIAAGFPFGRQSARLVALGPGYIEVSQQVVGRRGGLEIKNIKELSQAPPLWMTPSSARLETLKGVRNEYPELQWRVLPDYTNEELLEMVWKRSLPLTLVESNTVRMNRRFFPELVVYFNLGDPQKLAWAMHPQSRHLQKAVHLWFDQLDTQKKVEGLTDHYFSHIEEFDYVDIARYRRRISDRLPKYQAYFEEASLKYGLDWHLIAAQAYQESHWNPKAKSYTGVRGIMMLTQETAKTLGLKNRLAVKESIFAGTRHLARLHKKVGDDVPEPDRTFMALAAYNIGYGHLQDARTLAYRLEKPADTWHGVRSVLPLLQKKAYYRSTAHGYARGTEAVQYVDRIRTYHKVLIAAMTPGGPSGDDQ
jgi:membrane-bound lytic murein transglycosylase F